MKKEQSKKPVGRPSKGKRVTVPVKLPQSDHAEIKAFANAHNIEMMELFRRTALKVARGQLKIELGP